MKSAANLLASMASSEQSLLNIRWYLPAASKLRRVVFWKSQRWVAGSNPPAQSTDSGLAMSAQILLWLWHLVPLIADIPPWRLAFVSLELGVKLIPMRVAWLHITHYLVSELIHVNSFRHSLISLSILTLPKKSEATCVDIWKWRCIYWWGNQPSATNDIVLWLIVVKIAVSSVLNCMRVVTFHIINALLTSIIPSMTRFTILLIRTLAIPLNLVLTAGTESISPSRTYQILNYWLHLFMMCQSLLDLQGWIILNLLKNIRVHLEYFLSIHATSNPSNSHSLTLALRLHTSLCVLLIIHINSVILIWVSQAGLILLLLCALISVLELHLVSEVSVLVILLSHDLTYLLRSLRTVIISCSWVNYLTGYSLREVRLPINLLVWGCSGLDTVAFLFLVQHWWINNQILLAFSSWGYFSNVVHELLSGSHVVGCLLVVDLCRSEVVIFGVAHWISRSCQDLLWLVNHCLRESLILNQISICLLNHILCSLG